MKMEQFVILCRNDHFFMKRSLKFDIVKFFVMCENINNVCHSISILIGNIYCTQHISSYNYNLLLLLLILVLLVQE